MVLLIFGIVLFLSLIVYVAYIAIQKEKPEEVRPTIHASGIYSVVRRSPREHLHPAKPTWEALKAHIDSQNEKSDGTALSQTEKETLLERWKISIEGNIQTVEKGDREGVEFYVYRSARECPYNKSWREKKCFVTREQIHQNPALIPPLHLGCECVLVPDMEWKKGQESQLSSEALLDRKDFRQPDWKEIA